MHAECPSRFGRSIDECSYLSQSSCQRVGGRDDAAEFLTLLSAMDAVGLGGEATLAVLRVAVAVLRIGNIRFSESIDSGEEVAASVVDTSALRSVAMLLRVDEEKLHEALTDRQAGSRRALGGL